MEIFQAKIESLFMEKNFIFVIVGVIVTIIMIILIPIVFCLEEEKDFTVQ